MPLPLELGPHMSTGPVMAKTKMCPYCKTKPSRNQKATRGWSACSKTCSLLWRKKYLQDKDKRARDRRKALSGTDWSK